MQTPLHGAAPSPRDTALLLLGVSLLTTSMRRSEATATDRVRRDVIHSAYRLRRRADVTRSTLETVLGAVLLATAVLRLARRGIAVAEEVLGLDIAGTDPPETFAAPPAP